MPEDKKCTTAIVDWFYSSEGEEYANYTVGNDGVTEIVYHTPRGEGDRHYVDVYNEDGSITREFNINTLRFE